MVHSWRSLSFVGVLVLASVAAVILPAEANAAAFVEDSLVETGGVLLQNHTGQTGATWAKITGVADGELIFTTSTPNYLRLNSENSVAYYSSGVPSSADYDVQVTMLRSGTVANGVIGLALRADTTAQTYYEGRYHIGSETWGIFRWVDGTPTSLGTHTETLAAGTKQIVKLSARGSRISLSVNGRVIISVVDSTISSAGRAGITGTGVGAQSDGTAFLMLSNFIASNVDSDLFVEDTMVDTAGVLLQNHTGQTGATWAKALSSGSTDLVFTTSPGNAIRYPMYDDVNVPTYYASGVPTSADYDVEATFKKIDSATAGTFGITSRADTSVETYYLARYWGAGAVWQLLKVINGSGTLLGSFEQNLTAGEQYTLRLSTRSTSIAMYVNGSAVVHVIDSSITSAGRAGISGIVIGGSDTDADALLVITDFRAKNANAVRVTNAHTFFSPMNWEFSGSDYARTSVSGAYFKVNFSGTTLKLNLDPSSMSGTEDYPILSYSIDGGALTRVQTSASTIIDLTPTPLYPGTHSVAVYVDAMPFTDRWTPVDMFKLLSFDIDSGATTTAPTLKSKRMVMYGDSIAEGSVQLTSTNNTTSTAWTTSFTKKLADLLDAEVGSIAHQGQGYERTAPNGDVPGLLYSYDLTSTGTARTFTSVDYVFNEHGANGTTTESDVSTMVSNLRAVFANAALIFTVPFKQANKTVITDGFNSQSDSRAFLIDLGSSGSDIITNNSTDANHPTPAGHTLIANALYAALDLTAPSVSVSAPTNGATVSSTTAITATASDGTEVYSVRFYRGSNTAIGSLDTSSPFTVNWDTTALSDGSQTLFAVARDTMGNVTTSSGITVTVDNTEPSRSGGSPTGTLAAGTTATTLSITTDESATCKYSASSGTAFASMTAFTTTGGTSHSTSISVTSDGNSYSYYVKCQDGVGNVNGSDTTITFTTTAGSGGGDDESDDDDDTPSDTGGGGSTIPGSAPVSSGSPFNTDPFAPLPGLTPDPGSETPTGPVYGPIGPGDPASAPLVPPPSVPTPPNTLLIPLLFTRDLRVGSVGEDVRALQRTLIANGFLAAGNVTGYFGPKTRAALGALQKANGMKVDGVLSAEVRQRLADLPGLTIPVAPVLFQRPLSVGSRGEEVRVLQTLLKQIPGIYPEGRITGTFGSLTKNAVGRFQLKYGLVKSTNDPAYGHVGPATRMKLNQLLRGATP